MPPWNPAKAKVQLRISVQRLRMIQQKKEAQAKMSRRDIATLIEKGKLETARVKVETIINEDIHIELLELLELYCELLLARFSILDINSPEPDPAVSEGVCAIIYAAPRTELKELHILRDILMHKYGREYSQAVMDNTDSRVSGRIVRKLDISMPSPDLVDAYLGEIAKSYAVAWTHPAEPNVKEEADVDEEVAKESILDESTTLPPHYTPGNSKVVDSGLKLPEIPPTDDSPTEGGAKSKTSTIPPEADKPEDEFEALNRRFAALKKK